MSQQTIKGYKVFYPNMTCSPNGKKFQYEVGKEYKHDGEIIICRVGFHFCIKAAHCFSYYSFDHTNIVCEVEAIGKTLTHSEDSKICTDHIRIIRKLTWDEVLKVANDGANNTGHSNSGDSNSGDSNSGDRNSGDSNSGYRNSGAFCTDNNPKIWLFDKPTEIYVRDWENGRAVKIMYEYLNFCIWVPSSIMTDEEKKAHPKYETTEGYLKTISHKEGWANMWGNLSEENRRVFLDLPNFDAKKFEEITGIKTEK